VTAHTPKMPPAAASRVTVRPYQALGRSGLVMRRYHVSAVKDDEAKRLPRLTASVTTVPKPGDATLGWPARARLAGVQAGRRRSGLHGHLPCGGRLQRDGRHTDVRRRGPVMGQTASMIFMCWR
jgi:hypothetical protein